MTKARTLGNFVSTGNPLSDGTIAAAEVTGLATVATSGSYNDLSNKPTITTTATNIAGGSNGTIPYQSAADTTQMLAAGTSGYFLKSNGVAAPSWDVVPATTPAGSSGQLQYNNAGAFAAVSSGTSGQLLTSAGSGAVPTWTTPATPASGLTLVQTVNASGSTVIVDGFSSAYDNYTLLISDLYPAADNRNLELKFYIDGTLISANYQYAYSNVNAASLIADIGSTSNSTIRLANSMNQTTFSRSNQYEINIFAVNGASTYKSILFNGVYHYDDITFSIRGAGTQTGTSGVLTGLQITFPGSSFGGGKFQLYGYAKA